MGQEDGWVHLKPLVTGQKASWQSDTGSIGFNNRAWTIFSKWSYSATWFGIFSLGKILPLSLFIIFLQVRFSKTFSYWTGPKGIFKSGKYINLGTKRSFGDKLEWSPVLRTSNYFIKKIFKWFSKSHTWDMKYIMVTGVRRFGIYAELPAIGLHSWWKNTKNPPFLLGSEESNTNKFRYTFTLKASDVHNAMKYIN